MTETFGKIKNFTQKPYVDKNPHTGDFAGNLVRYSTSTTSRENDPNIRTLEFLFFIPRKITSNWKTNTFEFMNRELCTRDKGGFI